MKEWWSLYPQNLRLGTVDDGALKSGPVITGRYDPETARAVREALEHAAQKIENLSGNPTYKAAWKIAARTVRSSKPD